MCTFVKQTNQNILKMSVIFTTNQEEVMIELAKFIQLKGLKVETKEQMDFAFSSYLQSNASNYYFKADELERKQFSNNVKKQLN